MNRSLATAAFGLALLAALAGCSSSSSSPSLPPAPAPTATTAPQSTVTPLPLPTQLPGPKTLVNATGSLVLAINFPATTGAVARANITQTPLQQQGATASSTTGVCASSPCLVPVSGPLGFNQYNINLVDANGNVLATGAVRAMILGGFQATQGVVFGGTPASIALSTEPKQVNIGTATPLEFTLVIKDAAGNRVIGTTPLAKPITIGGADNGAAVIFSNGNTFTTPNSVVKAQYNGSTASPLLKFAFTSGTSSLRPLAHMRSSDGTSSLEVDAPLAAQHVTIGGQPQDLSGYTPSDDEESAEEGDEIAEEPKSFFSRPLAALPSKVDLAPNFPTPGNQGDQGSCASFSSAYGMLSYIYKTKNAWSLFTTSGGLDYGKVFSPAFIYNQTNNGNKDAGGVMEEVADFIKTNGVSTWASMPYNNSDWTTQPSAGAKAEAGSYKITDWKPIAAGDLTAAKNALAAGQPIYWGIQVDDAFQNLGANNAVWNGPVKNGGGHAMVLVGYDESLQAFKILNSWDVSWATSGFGWISYTAWQNTPDQTNIVFVP